MKKVLLILVPLFTMVTLHSHAQQSQVILDYIDKYKALAISEMQRTGVPASIKLAQGIHETMAGTSPLVLKSNNHFGIKCKSTWNGPSVSHDDDARGECFRKYTSPEDSYRDHSDFLKNGARYASLFKLEPTNYSAWAYGLKKAGYATNPKYPTIIIRLIEEYQLQDYTLIAMGKKQVEGDWGNKEVLPSSETSQPLAAVVLIDEPVENKTIYPSGAFWINDTRVVFVKRGTSYLSIAQQYDVSLNRIFDFNEMRPAETAAIDELVYLQRKRKTGKDDFHVVKPGETLRDIAQLHGIRLESLLEYNWLKDGMQPAAGERLALRGKSAVIPKLALKDNYSLVPSERPIGSN